MQAPSTRVTEEQLRLAEGVLPKREWQNTPGHLTAAEMNQAMDDELQRLKALSDRAPSTSELVAEIRRYRALLIGLDGLLPGPTGWCARCKRSVVAAESERHDDGCPAAELEAEVQAIRDERKGDLDTRG